MNEIKPKKSIKEIIIERLTPKRTEEVKPNLFIQQINPPDKPDKYRQIIPVAWNGKIINKTVLIFGAKPVWSTITFIAILLMAYGYVHDGQARDDFYNQVIFNQSYTQYLCTLNLQSNLSQVYGLNITDYCHGKIIITNSTQILNLSIIKLND